MQFLFDRLERAPAYEGGPFRAFDLKAAVLAQVQRIVGARLPAMEGGVMAAPQFGMPSVVELGTGDSARLAAYTARLVRMLAHYEPRLLAPSVAVVASGDPLCPYQLVVRGALAADDGELVYTFPMGQR